MIVDFCAYLGHWPYYPLPVADCKALIEAMDRSAIDAAFVSLIDAAFLLDPRVGNERLDSLVDGHQGRILPLGTVDVTLPCWQDDLSEGLERYGFTGLRIYPGYHGYAVNDGEAVALAKRLAKRQLPLFIPFLIEEERFRHPSLQVASLPVAQIADLIRQAPDTTIVLNSVPVEQATALLGAPDLPLDNVFIDINAMDKPFDGLIRLIESYGSDRLVFGSQVPFLYPEATFALAQEAQLSFPEAVAILEHNWRSSETLRRLVLPATATSHTSESEK